MRSIELSENTPLQGCGRDEESGILVAYAAVPSAPPPDVVVSNSELSTLRRASSYLTEVGASLHTTVLHSRSALVRSVSDKILPRPTVFCGICLEHVAREECYSFSGGDFDRDAAGAAELELTGCDHLYCVDCLRGYIISAITDFNPAPTCPFQGSSETADAFSAPFAGADEHHKDGVGFGCGARASEADVRHLLRDLGGGGELLKKYEKVRVITSNRDFRECPGCGHLQLPARDFLRRVKPAMTCGQCGSKFCFEVRSVYFCFLLL